jgi:hypothetical protein
MDTQEIVRVIRVLEYEGPRDWIVTVLGRSFVRKDGVGGGLGPNRAIREISVSEPEVVKTLVNT